MKLSRDMKNILCEKYIFLKIKKRIDYSGNRSRIAFLLQLQSLHVHTKNYLFSRAASKRDSCKNVHISHEHASIIVCLVRVIPVHYRVLSTLAKASDLCHLADLEDPSP